MKDLQLTGFPAGNYPQICTALRAGKFLRENGLEIEGVDGPPSGLSTTVVVRYRLSEPSGRTSPAPPQQIVPGDEWANETPREKAFRLTSRLRGLMKEEFAAYGGGEAFLRWIRSDDGSEPPTRPAK